ncbi:MAG: SAM-dependent methyltransferase [Clostridia bacterium]|nr:SAM-dependent methyltransferase [Clostridia bacterium]
MNMNETKIAEFANAVTLAASENRLKNITFSSFPKGEISKVKGTPKLISGKNVIQFEYFLTEGRVRHENASANDLSSVIPSIISLGAHNCQLTAANGTATLLVSSKGVVNVSYKLAKQIKDLIKTVNTNDRNKKYIFDGKESFMIELGISDKEGRVHDKKQSKFRQINRFAEQVRDVMKYLPKEGPLSVYDLCCGKSYLSFALYSYLTERSGREVSMICVDMKESVMRECGEISERLGYKGMSFITGNVFDLIPESPPDLVLSLHACDTATDAVLSFAVNSRAKIVLSTPCCQREMFNIMDCPELSFISKYSILKQKIASAATDALRLARLEAHGYKTDAIELIDPDDTPKNVLLRGILKDNFDPGSAQAKSKYDEYAKYYKFMTGELPEIDRT